ncbi:MAG: TolC family protein [Xylophilus ampelinus]
MLLRKDPAGTAARTALLLSALLPLHWGAARAQTTGTPLVPRPFSVPASPAFGAPAPVPQQPPAFPGSASPSFPAPAAPNLPPTFPAPDASRPPPPNTVPPSSIASTAPTVEMTLQQLTDTVLQHNPALLSAQQVRSTAAAAVTTAGAFPNPRLEFTGGRQSARIPSSLGGNVTTYGVSQLIENPALRSSRVEAARSGQRGSEFQVAVNRNELIAQIRLRAYEFLLRQAEAGAAAEALGLLEQSRTRVQARVDSGEAGRYEIIKADAELVTARQRRQSALLMADQAALALNRLAAGQLPPRWTLTDIRLVDNAPLPNLEVLQQQAFSNNPELQFLQSEIDRANATLDGARASRWPGVELRYSQARDPEVRQNVLGVSVQVPLFDRRTGPIAEASSELVRARTRLEGRQAELQQQILSAWKTLEMARLRVDALSQGAVRDSESALRVAEAAYRYGERGILDVLDAQRVLRTVRSDLLDARYQVQSARIELDYLAGRLVNPPVDAPASAAAPSAAIRP